MTPCQSGMEPGPDSGIDTPGREVGAASVASSTPRGNSGSVQEPENSTDPAPVRKKPKNRGQKQRRGKPAPGSAPEPETSGETPGEASASPSAPAACISVTIHNSDSPGMCIITSGKASYADSLLGSPIGAPIGPMTFRRDTIRSMGSSHPFGGILPGFPRSQYQAL